MFKLLILVGLFFASLPVLGVPWTKEEINAYEKRNFIFLEHLLVSHQELGAALKMREQEKDLAGCRSLHNGSGGIATALRCISFLNREGKWGLNSKGSAGLIRDINILCEKFVEEPGALKKLLQSPIFEPDNPKWTPCLRQTWKQVYLTTYANFSANPVGTLALVRKAERMLPSVAPWASKMKALLMQQ